MREYMAQAMIEMTKRRYGPLFQELQLTPAQIEQFIQVMNGTYQKGIQKLAALPDGTASPAQALGDSEAEKADVKKQLESVLGQNGLTRFNEYTHELPARTTVDLLNGQLGSSKLDEEQRSRLFQIVKAEPFELTHGITGDFDKAFLGSRDQAETYVSNISESNQRIMQQAGSFLNPEQLTALNTVLTNGITARLTQAAAFTQKH